MKLDERFGPTPAVPGEKSGLAIQVDAGLGRKIGLPPASAFVRGPEEAIPRYFRGILGPLRAIPRTSESPRTLRSHSEGLQSGSQGVQSHSEELQSRSELLQNHSEELQSGSQVVESQSEVLQRRSRGPFGGCHEPRRGTEGLS
jgi:hypothetical protein